MTQGTQQKSLARNYIPGFDGLRALAALAVIGFHLQIPGFSLGWAGVNLFFVLSGFLITRILIQSRSSPAFFRRFYFRRVLRILPIYYLGLLVVLAVGTIKHWNLTDWPWYVFYAQNVRLAETAFFPHFPALFNHTWSLAEEEQFYFVWPLAVWILSRKGLWVLVICLIIFAPACRWVAIEFTGNPFAVFALLQCIIDALAWGAAAALFSDRIQEWKVHLIFRRIVGVLITLVTLCGGLALTRGLSNFWSPLNYLLNWETGVLFFGLLGPLFASLLLVVHLRGAEWLVTALEWTPLRNLGRISYGLYFYHWPVILLVSGILGRITSHFSSLAPAGSTVLALLTVAITVGISSTSYHFIEKPFLNLKHRIAPQMTNGQ